MQQYIFLISFVQLTKLRTDYAALQDNAIQQLTQMDSDARLAEMREQLMQIRAASEGTEEKLRSEVKAAKNVLGTLLGQHLYKEIRQG